MRVRRYGNSATVVSTIPAYNPAAYTIYSQFAKREINDSARIRTCFFLALYTTEAHCITPIQFPSFWIGTTGATNSLFTTAKLGCKKDQYSAHNDMK